MKEEKSENPLKRFSILTLCRFNEYLCTFEPDAKRWNIASDLRSKIDEKIETSRWKYEQLIKDHEKEDKKDG